MKYNNIGTFNFKQGVIKCDIMKLIYNIARKSKLDFITFFIDDYFFYIAEVAYANNIKIFYRCPRTLEDIEGDYVEISDQTIYQKEEENKNSIDMGLEDINDMFTNLDGFNMEEETESKSTVVRFCTHIKMLEALSLFDKDIDLIVDSEKITLVSDGTILHYNSIRTMLDLVNTSVIFDDLPWEKLKTDAVVNIATTMLKTKDIAAKRYIMLEGDKIYYNGGGGSFSVEATAWNMTRDYILPYPIIEIIKSINQKKLTQISQRERELFLEVEGLMLSIVLQSEEMLNSALIDRIPKYNYGMVCCVLNPKEEWSKIKLIETQSLDDFGVVELSTTENGITFTKNQNMRFVKGDANQGFKIGIELELLDLARKLSGSDVPKIYADCTGSLATLLIIGELTVAIRAKYIEVDTNFTSKITKLQVKLSKDSLNTSPSMGSLRSDEEISLSQDNINTTENEYSGDERYKDLDEIKEESKEVPDFKEDTFLSFGSGGMLNENEL